MGYATHHMNLSDLGSAGFSGVFLFEAKRHVRKPRLRQVVKMIPGGGTDFGAQDINDARELEATTTYLPPSVIPAAYASYSDPPPLWFPNIRSTLMMLYLADSIASLQGHECCTGFSCFSPDFQLSIAPRTPG